MKRYRYRQLILLLMALILPMLAIVMMGWMILGQDRKLSEKSKQEQFAADQKRAMNDIRQYILTRLDRIRYQESTTAAATGVGAYTDPAVRLVGRLDGNRLILPWEIDTNKDRSRRAADEPKLKEQIRDAEIAENSDILRAIALYRKVENASKQPLLMRSLLARALWKSGGGGRAEAVEIDRGLLKQPSSLTDEEEFPFAYQGAYRLAENHAAEQEILSRVLEDLNVNSPAATLSPVLVSQWKDILDKLQKSGDSAICSGAQSASERLAAVTKELDRARTLQADFPKLRVNEKGWLTHGEPPWLVGLGLAAADSRPLVIAVQANDIFKDVESAIRPKDLVFHITSGSGELLGNDLAGLGVTFQSTAAAATRSLLRESFYGLSLVMVIGVTFLGGFLLWRDTRREVRTSELRSQFVSSVSHELKTPLTAIRMFAETLQMRGATDPQIYDEYLGTIINESERLTRLLNNVLDFSRIERDQKAYQMKPTQLADVVNAAARAMQYPLAEQGFHLSVDVAEGIPLVQVDHDAIEQAILNLLTNAMKYSGQSRDIALRLVSRNGKALIQVADHGIGIPEKERKRIFERFYRVRTPENQAIAGAGLGLALVAHIVEAHGAKIEIESTPGAGSTFSICLPVKGDTHEPRIDH
jgi:signal transduction histidine kinase